MTPPDADEDAELDPPYTADKNVQWCTHCGKQFGGGLCLLYALLKALRCLFPLLFAFGWEIASLFSLKRFLFF